jgi:hypothetical protein
MIEVGQPTGQGYLPLRHYPWQDVFYRFSRRQSRAVDQLNNNAFEALLFERDSYQLSDANSALLLGSKTIVKKIEAGW